MEEDETSSVLSDGSAPGGVGVGAGAGAREGAQADPQKPFLCTLCGSSFTRRENLKVHMRKHTGVRPFLCTFCNKAFTRAYSCKQHMQVRGTS